jgi:hypothetical protein
MRRHYPKVSPSNLQRVFCAELKALIPWMAAAPKIDKSRDVILSILTGMLHAPTPIG